MSRVGNKARTKADWRNGVSPAYGVKARRNLEETTKRALREHQEALDKRSQGV